MLDLSATKLTESILQSCYKSKTYVRNGEWDILWHLGGRNNVTIGQKDDDFYILPTEVEEVVTELLPFELVQGTCRRTCNHPKLISNLEELQSVYPELEKYYSNIRRM